MASPTSVCLFLGLALEFVSADAVSSGHDVTIQSSHSLFHLPFFCGPIKNNKRKKNIEENIGKYKTTEKDLRFFFLIFDFDFDFFFFF